MRPPLNLYSLNDKVTFVGLQHLPKLFGAREQNATTGVTLRATGSDIDVIGLQQNLSKIFPTSRANLRSVFKAVASMPLHFNRTPSDVSSTSGGKDVCLGCSV